MNKVLLDTDIYSEVLKEIDPRVGDRAAAYREEYDRFTITAVTVMEIVKGLRRMARPDRAERLLRQLRTTEVLSFDADAATVAGQIFADLERIGQLIGHADPMIAAVAVRHGLPLVTGNGKHFERIQALGYALELENWRV